MSPLTPPRVLASAVCRLALAIGCVWSRRLTLQVHGAIYLSLAFAAYGPLSRGPAGIALAAVCYAGVRWTPLRIFLFAGIAWTTANFAASIAPTSLQLALKLVIYGAALIVLPRLRANRAAGSADSETTPRPHDSVAKSGTASGAA